MSALIEATNKSQRTLRLSVMAAALGVAGMFTAAATFAGSEAQAGETAPNVAAAQR